MTAALFPYQEEGAQRLAERSKLYLGDDVGLGKTRTVLRGLQLAGVTDAVVLCPAVVRQHWHDEAAALEYRGRLTVLSYQKFVLNPEIRQSGDALVLDEAHYLKRPESKRTELIMGPDGFHTRFQRVWPVSGTPMPRNPMELHPVLAALWPKRLQALGVLRPGAWLNRYCLWRAGEYGPRIYGARPEALMELKELLALVMLRRRAVDVAPEMPPASWGTVTVEAEDLASLPYLTAETAAALERGELPPMDANLARYLHAVGDLKAPYVAALLADELEDTGPQEDVGLTEAGGAHAPKVVLNARAHAATVVTAKADGNGVNVGQRAAQVVSGSHRAGRRMVRVDLGLVGR